MIDVKWNDNAKAAVDYFADWLRADYSYIANLEDFYSRLPQTKTVADAVEYFDGIWPNPIVGNPPPYDEQVIIYCTKGDECGSEVGEYYAGGCHFDSSYFYQVCTRAEFEAYVKEQEGEKWTHTWCNEPCRVKVGFEDSKGQIVIEDENGEYYVCKAKNLKPIKLMISKAEAWDLCQDYEGSQSMVKYMLELHEQYDII